MVLYQLCFGTPLWKTDTDDNVDLEGLQLIASVPDAPLRTVLGKALSKGVIRSASVDLTIATALLRKLLEPDPSKRLGHFEMFDRPMVGVLEEPFFQGQRLDAASQEEILKEVRELRVEQDEQTALLIVIKDLSYDNKIELLHTRKALMKGIFEATEVKTPTTFIILDEKQNQLLASLKENGSGVELTCDAKVEKERLDKVMTWLERLQTFGEGVTENNPNSNTGPNKVFGTIKEALGDLMTKETMYL